MSEPALTPFVGIFDDDEKDVDPVQDLENEAWLAKELVTGPAVKKEKKVKSQPKRKRATVPKPTETKKRAKKNSDTNPDKAYRTLVAYSRAKHIGPYLRLEGFDLNVKRLRKMKPEKLSDELKEVERCLANNAESAIGNMMVLKGLEVGEEICHNHTRFKIQGTTNKLFENDHWVFLLERVKIKYGMGLGELDPLTEMSLIAFQTMALTHYDNLLPKQPITNLETKINID